MIIGFEVVFASIAAILCILSFRTLRAIKHLGVGKSFWIPVLTSSSLFLITSFVTILNEMNVSPIPQTVTIAQVGRILALCTLSCAIYVYSRRVKASLREEFTIPQQTLEELSVQVPLEEKEVEAPIQKRRVRASLNQDQPIVETATECKHQLGYLRTLPGNAPIPGECFGCDQIIECKHPLVNTLNSCATDQ